MVLLVHTHTTPPFDGEPDQLSDLKAARPRNLTAEHHLVDDAKVQKNIINTLAGQFVAFSCRHRSLSELVLSLEWHGASEQGRRPAACVGRFLDVQPGWLIYTHCWARPVPFPDNQEACEIRKLVAGGPGVLVPPPEAPAMPSATQARS